MTEDFLHYLWKNKLFDTSDLRTTSGELLRIVASGFHNFDAGPDFRQAVVQIGDITWAGDVEIHIRSSDWFRHHHEKDEKYKSVALHVVYEHDMEVERQPGEYYPTLELKDRIPKGKWLQYQQLVGSVEMVPCCHYLSHFEELHLQSLVSSMAMERLLRKYEDIMSLHAQCRADWDETLYRQVAVSFGFKANASAFELLARSLPYKILLRHSDSALQVRALLFGQAGMLDLPHVDTYYDSLKYEYEYLRYKYQLQPIGRHHWNWLRLRPSNFPCLRLAQLAALIHKTPELLRTLLDCPSIEQYQDLFAVEADSYWETHYQFGKETLLPHSVSLGATAFQFLMINTVVPVLFAYYRFFGDQSKQEDVVAMWDQIPFEDNKVTRVFRDTAFPQRTALDSQALIELLQCYCKEKRCIDCAIGERIVRDVGG